jgi:hypothetical protein
MMKIVVNKGVVKPWTWLHVCLAKKKKKKKKNGTRHRQVRDTTVHFFLNKKNTNLLTWHDYHHRLKIK